MARYIRRNVAKELLYNYPSLCKAIKERETDISLSSSSNIAMSRTSSISDSTYSHAEKMSKDKELAEWRREAKMVEDLLRWADLTGLYTRELIELIYFHKGGMKLTIPQAAVRLGIAEKDAKHRNYVIVDELYRIMKRG